MKNKYIVEGNTVKIFLHRLDGTYIITVIDLEDFDRVNSYAGTFCARYYYPSNKCYPGISLYLGKINGKYAYDIVRLNKIIMNYFDNDKVVDHKNFDTLDNRKENLRLVDVSGNLKNRSNKNKNNSSGYRNVCFVGNKWIVQLQVDGKNKLLGKFDNVDDAGRFAEEMRAKYYGEYAGN